MALSDLFRRRPTPQAETPAPQFEQKTPEGPKPQGNPKGFSIAGAEIANIDGRLLPCAEIKTPMLYNYKDKMGFEKKDPISARVAYDPSTSKLVETGDFIVQVRPGVEKEMHNITHGGLVNPDMDISSQIIDQRFPVHTVPEEKIMYDLDAFIDSNQYEIKRTIDEAARHMAHGIKIGREVPSNFEDITAAAEANTNENSYENGLE